MNRVKAFIIDDEPAAVRVLNGMLTEFCANQVEVIGHAHSDIEALIWLSNNAVDLVFLDIQLSSVANGLDLMAQIPNRQFDIIVTTAYESYAIEAVNNLEPKGYLTKPINIKRMIALVNKVFVAHNTPPAHQAQTILAPLDLATGVIVSDPPRGNVVIRLQDLIYLKAEHATVLLFYLQDGKVLRIVNYKTLKEWEQTLPGCFFRIHHNSLANMNFIQRYVTNGRSGTAILSNNIELDISVARYAEFQERFSTFVLTGQ